MHYRHNQSLTLLRERCKPLGLNVKQEALYALLIKTTFDVDLALTALLMSPRPSWLSEIVGA